MSTMDIGRLVARLRTLDVSLWVEDGRLHYDGPPEAVTDALLDELAANKAALVAYLEGARSGAAARYPSITPSHARGRSRSASRSSACGSWSSSRPAPPPITCRSRSRSRVISTVAR